MLKYARTFNENMIKLRSKVTDNRKSRVNIEESKYLPWFSALLQCE